MAVSIQYRIAKDNPPALPGPAPTPEKSEQFRLMNAAFQDTCDAVRWVRANADKYSIDPNRIGIGGVSAGAFNGLHTAFCDDKLTGPDAKVAAVISLMGAIAANHIDENDPPVFIAHGKPKIGGSLSFGAPSKRSAEFTPVESTPFLKAALNTIREIATAARSETEAILGALDTLKDEDRSYALDEMQRAGEAATTGAAGRCFSTRSGSFRGSSSF